MQPAPDVSVILAVRNGGSDLPKAIGTIFEQTFVNLELVVVNNGSIDGTSAFLKTIEDPRLRVFDHAEPGLAGALNHEIARARGRYIARQDHDDWALPTRIERQVQYLDSHPDRALVGTRAEIWVGDVPAHRYHDHPTDDVALRFELLFNNPFVHSSVMLRKAALEAVGCYTTNPIRQPPEDYELWSRLARRFRVANLPEQLAIYREVPNSISRVGNSPFMQKLVMISSENLAHATGVAEPEQTHIDIAALTHSSEAQVSPKPDFRAMCAIIREAGRGIGGSQPSEDLLRRIAAAEGRLKQRLRLRQPGYKSPIIAGRAIRKGLRWLRSACFDDGRIMKNTHERDGLFDFEAPLRGQRVFVTGHTGFTGGWLVLWLNQLGCEVAGLALTPDTQPNLFTAAQIADCMVSTIGDIRDLALVKSAVERSNPSIIFHLAAQPLVSRSFVDPIETFETNVIGTANVLEAARLAAGVKGVVCVTTDKVYQDQGGSRGYRETDPLGGKDPYSASKACAELVAMCYQQTLAGRGNGVMVATARGGNIIGGGDWSADRLVPDFVRAVVSGKPIALRNSRAIRPWQHVMGLVHGYLVLAGRLISGDRAAASNWNFGPTDDEIRSVGALVEQLGAAWVRPEVVETYGTFPETQILRLDSGNARARLGWLPPLTFDKTVQLTATWYRDFIAAPDQARRLSFAQIESYRATSALGSAGSAFGDGHPDQREKGQRA